MPGELWRERRITRPIREDVPIESDEENIDKARRTHEGFRVLREKIAELKTDVLIVFSDDQLECFDFNNYPAFAVYVGDEFRKSPGRGGGDGGGGAARPQGGGEGRPAAANGGGEGRPNAGASGPPPPGQQMGRHAAPGATFKGHPDLAVALLAGVMKRGFDPSFCMDMPKPDRGLAGGVIRTMEELSDFPNIPAVPVMMNLYFAPQPTGMRCYQFGKAVREVIEEFPGDLRVAVCGSGGLWHTPNAKDAWLNVDFDLKTLELLKVGDIRGMAEHFDSYVIPADDASQNTSERGRNITGMPSPGGPALGTRETCAWIAAAGVVDGSEHVIVDYVDAYASPVGNAFAYCTNF